MIAEVIKRKSYKPTIYADSEEGLRQFCSDVGRYFDYLSGLNADQCEESQKVIPSIEGLCAFCGMSRKTLWKYYKNRGQQWQDSIDYIKTCLASVKIQLAQRYKIPPSVLFFDLVNNYDYQNTYSVKIEESTNYEERLTNQQIFDQLPKEDENETESNISLLSGINLYDETY